MEDAEVRGRGQGGFTLIEMLIVMVILAVRSTLASTIGLDGSGVETDSACPGASVRGPGIQSCGPVSPGWAAPCNHCQRLAAFPWCCPAQDRRGRFAQSIRSTNSSVDTSPELLNAAQWSSGSTGVVASFRRW